MKVAEIQDVDAQRANTDIALDSVVHIVPVPQLLVQVEMEMPGQRLEPRHRLEHSSCVYCSIASCVLRWPRGLR